MAMERSFEYQGRRQGASSPPSSIPSSPSSTALHNQVMKVRLEEELLVKLAIGEAEVRLGHESMASLLGPSPLGLH